MSSAVTFLTVGMTAAASIIAVVVTYILTKRREHEADWRKLRFSQYQEFVLALSGVVRGHGKPNIGKQML